MVLEFSAIPLAFFAGVIGIISPCIWPLVPVMMSSAAQTGRSGPIFLALGLASAFAVAGTVLTLLLINAGLNPDAFRGVAAVMLILVGLPLLSKRMGDLVSNALSRGLSRFQTDVPQANSNVGQFSIGALLGLVWLPCVGPTLGAAIALASMGQNMVMAATVMFVFGIGTALALLLAALLSGQAFKRLRPGTTLAGTQGKRVLGIILVLLGLLVLTGTDKQLETWALDYLPDWATQL